MKNFFYLTTAALLLFSLHASAMLFSSSETPVEEFQKYVLQTNQVSYTQWVKEQAQQTGKSPHDAVVSFVEQTLQQPKQVDFITWDRLRADLEINPQDREILSSLASKLREEGSRDEKVLLEFCRYQVLSAESPSPECSSKLQKWHLSFALADDDLLLIDGLPFNKSTLPSRLIPGKYHWRLISDRYQDQEWSGTLQDSGAQERISKPWIVGSCKDAQLTHPDFGVLSQAQMYLSKDCQESGLPHERTWGSWIEDHKVLCWGLGVLATGAAAYQLRDKTLVFTRP